MTETLETQHPTPGQETRAIETMLIMTEFWTDDDLALVLIRPQPQMGGKSIIQSWVEGDYDAPLDLMNRLNDGVYL